MAKTPTNSLTSACINYLNLNGFCVWRNNNGATYSVKQQTHIKLAHHKKGVPDIIGYHKKTGKAIWCEIKTGRDKLSIHQQQFIEDARNANCDALVIRTLDELIKIITAIK